jgi:hypothetical protein
VKLVAHRVVQPGTAPNRRTGFNAFYFGHGDRFWLDVPPGDLGPGQLVNQIIEVQPPGNRVRSYLEIVAPDVTPNMQIAAAVQAGADFLADAGAPQPWRLAHGEVSFIFEAEAALAAQWQVELRLLLGYALAVRREGPQGAGIFAGNIFQG